MDAHRNEYLAAVAGMAEIYGTNIAIGDHVWFRLSGWSPASSESGRVLDNHRDRLLVETETDVVEVDPRPWPLGNLLPF